MSDADRYRYPGYVVTADLEPWDGVPGRTLTWQTWVPDSYFGGESLPELLRRMADDLEWNEYDDGRP